LDWLYVWPTAGDVFGWGVEETDKAVVLAAGKILGNRSEGFVFKDDAADVPGDPLPSATVKNYRSDLGSDTEFGAGTTDAYGSYRTDVQGGPVGTVTVPTDFLAGGDQAIKTILESGGNPEDGGYARARWILRSSYRGVVEAALGRALGLDVSRAGRWARVYERDGTLRVGHAPNFDLTNWSDLDTGIACDYARCRYERAGVSDPLYVLVGASSTAYLYRIDSEGATPTLAFTIGSGDAGEALAVSDAMFLAWRKSSGTVYTTRYQKQGGTFAAVGTEQTTNLTGLDSDTFLAAGFYPDPTTGKRRIGLLHSVGGSLILRLSDDGITFDA
jgi:hypothetical protein